MLVQAFSKIGSSSSGAPYAPELLMVAADRRHLTRLFPSGSGGPTGTNGNVPSGTVVDREICRDGVNDFLLASHSGRKGTTKATRYTGAGQPPHISPLKPPSAPRPTAAADCHCASGQTRFREGRRKPRFPESLCPTLVRQPATCVSARPVPSANSAPGHDRGERCVRGRPPVPLPQACLSFVPLPARGQRRRAAALRPARSGCAVPACVAPAKVL